MTPAPDSAAFLGEEFLTWLWYRLETEGGEFELPGDREVGISFDDFIAFAPRENDETEQTLKKGVPSRSAEAAVALRNGHRLTRAKLLVALGEKQWSVTLDGPTMGLLGVRIPEDDSDVTDPRDRSSERMDGFLLLQEIFAGLYEKFLRRRLTPEYLSGEAELQANWMATR